jgi:hypothetical protein
MLIGINKIHSFYISLNWAYRPKPVIFLILMNSIILSIIFSPAKIMRGNQGAAKNKRN